ncbi:hypothetical protein G8770_06200 [Aestuariicella hydrocarbonica]|uniref:Uncharacterized protein n=1 Tax=Pseudomaricurvus hydrocarbonicus TaxID=1470433 RepID=A0A9E5JTD2_9GAMM|nr:hypothetical protein [Aestuariicella hydrocarbonica]NHO65131.1 hypothetical protein [Aestuariicella hydrocarbonica]
MSVERKEPTLSGLGPNRDEPVNSASSTKPHTQNSTSGAKPAAPQPRRRPAPVSSVQAKASPLVPLALILALTGLGLAGFSYWQLVTAQHHINASDKRIAELENRLALSDDESSQSVTALQLSLREAREQLKTSTSEIRKLWDTRNVNREGIAANKTQIASNSKAVKSAAAAAAEAKKLAQAQQASVKALNDSIALQAEQLGMMSDLSDVQQQRVRELVDQAGRVDAQLTKLQNNLVGRVQKNEAAIEAIDAYRVSINRDILDLKRRLNTTGTQ